jgi:hypothetical protein
MLRKISAVAVALGATMLVAAPANAVSDAASCTYDNASVNRVSGSVDVTLVSGDIDRLNVVGKIFNDGANREWIWTMYHNGSLSAGPGTVYGGSTITRTMINANGPDSVQFKFHNANNTVSCVASVSFGG